MRGMTAAAGIPSSVAYGDSFPQGKPRTGETEAGT